MVMAQNADGSGAEFEQPSRLRTQAEPAAGQGPQEVPMGEQRYIPWFFNGHGLVDDVLATLLHGSGIDSARAAVGPDRPVRHGTLDLCGRDAFVVAVIPLPAVCFHLSLGDQAPQLTGALGALERRTHHGCKGVSA